MAPMTIKVSDMLNNLEEEDYKTAITFIEYLSETRKQKRTNEDKKILSEIQDIFADDKGWDSEEDMLKDMALFRRERMGL